MVYIATAQEVEYARQVAANAAATNLAYQQNKLPVLPRYVQGEQQRQASEGVIAYDTSNLLDPINQQGRAYYISPEEDARREAAKQERAFSEPRNPYHSAAELALVRQYEMQRGNIVTGGGAYAARGELVLSDPSEELSGPVYSGRAAEYKSAWEREVYGIGAPDPEQEYYRREAERAVVERPGYTAPANLGDIQTQKMRQGYGMFSQALGLQGVQAATDYQMTGRFIEAQRQMAYATPTRRDERFFMGELQKWAEVPVEKASAYHDIGMESGKAIPANPYEYQADLAVEFLKGSPKKASEFFSPVSGEMSRHMPGGVGVQEFAWEEAKTDYARQTGAAQTPYPEQVSFMEGVTYLGAAEGKYGPYGKLAGGIDTGGVNLGAGRLRGGNIVGGGVAFGGATPIPKPFVSVSSPAASPDLMTQAGLWLAGAERTTVEYTGIGRLPTPTTEQIKEMGKNPLFMSTNPAAGALLNIPQTQEYAAAFIRGEAIQVQTKPLESAVSYGVGYVGGIAFKGLEYGAAVSRASFAEKAIAGGGGWRAAEIFAANAPKAGGMILTGAYAVSVGARATDWGRDFSPAAAERLGGIAVGEAIPGGLGFAHGVRTPGAIYKAAQISDIGYKASLQEGLTTGRASYYVKQPAVAAYERATLPITRAKLELPQFVEEAGGSKISGTARYAEYKIGSAYRSNIDIPAKTFIQETPIKIQRAGFAIAEPVMRARIEAVPRVQAAMGKVSIEFASWRYAKNQPIAEAAYSRYFTAKTKLPVAAESAYLSTYRSAWEIAQAAKTPGITIKSKWQEYGGIDITNIIRPTAEITRINKMSSFKYPEVSIASRQITKPMSKISTTFVSRKLAGEQPPIKSTSPEIKTKGGSLLSRMEEPIIRTQESFSVVEPRTSGLPVWPSGPSPIQRQRYAIEEEEQYYRLPPGMVSPGPKRETIQSITAMPMSGLITGQRVAFESISSQFQRFDQLQSIKQTQKERQRIEQISRVSPVFAFAQTPRDLTTQYSKRVSVPDITTVPYTGVTTVSRQDITTIPRLGDPYVPPTSTITRPRTPPETPKLPFGGFLPGGGGGSGYRGSLGITTWRRENLVATAEYLGRGMRDIGFGWGAGTGTYTEKTKWFSTGKKRSKRRKKK